MNPRPNQQPLTRPIIAEERVHDACFAVSGAQVDVHGTWAELTLFGFRLMERNSAVRLHWKVSREKYFFGC
jgi:hypothetical protein